MVGVAQLAEQAVSNLSESLTSGETRRVAGSSPVAGPHRLNQVRRGTEQPSGRFGHLA